MCGMQSKKKVIKEIVLPVPLPTWNRLLQIQWQTRKSLRDMIHQLVKVSVERDRTLPELAGLGWNYVRYYKLIGRKKCP